jgi:hypothetical protein
VRAATHERALAHVAAGAADCAVRWPALACVAVKLPIFLLCLLSQLFFFAFERGEAQAPTASVAAPPDQAQAALQGALADTQRLEAHVVDDASLALAPARIAIAQAVLAGHLDAFLPDLAELATWRGPPGARERG